MLKDPYGRECKICKRPFTVFKWSPGVGERWKKTEICQVCAKIKNSCQTCLLDLEYGLHTRDRDEVLGVHQSIPTTDVNAQVFVRSLEQKMGGAAVVNHGKAESVAKEVLKKLVKSTTDPYTQRNKTSICSFYIKGNCKRDKDCPFLHQMPENKKRIAKKILGGRIHSCRFQGKRVSRIGDDGKQCPTKIVRSRDSLSITKPCTTRHIYTLL
jgi:pre-mRNA-splicing factor RBM22/SLT11